MPRDITTPVLRNLDLGDGNFLLEFEAPGMVETMRPAQFFMIGIPGSETLLRRPYSVCGLPGTFDDGPAGAVQVLYKVFGRGTGLLAQLKPGAPVTVLGPLGRGFEPPPSPHTKPVFVAGGIGSAPFPAWAAELASGSSPRRAVMFYGARQAGELALHDWFERHCEALHVATEDGSRGTKGWVTEPLQRFLAESDPAKLHIYACGPEPMLKAVAKISLEAGVTCDLALEAHMACGFGVCLGCVVPTRGPDGGVAYERVCVEGPVMRAEHMAW